MPLESIKCSWCLNHVHLGGGYEAVMVRSTRFPSVNFHVHCRRAFTDRLHQALLQATGEHWPTSSGFVCELTWTAEQLKRYGYEAPSH